MTFTVKDDVFSSTCSKYLFKLVDAYYIIDHIDEQ
jgi:hypothetical protein